MALKTAPTEFAVDLTDRSMGLNKPQKIGGRLWLPMLAMALTAFGVGIIVGIVRANEISSSGLTETADSLRHVTAGFMFLGFASVFGAISFAIARILGVFRSGGGDVQEACERPVQTLKMPAAAKIFMAGMGMAMMLLLVTVVLHFVFAAVVSDSELSEQRFVVLEGFRRVGVSLYLASIAFGLATIIKVLRFQAIRIRELPEEPKI